MLKTKKVLTLLMALVLVLSAIFVMASCGRPPIETETETETETESDTETETESDTETETESDTETETETDTETETETETETDTNVEGEATFVVTVETQGKMPLSGIKVYVLDEAGNITKDRIGTTDNKGKVTFTLPTDEEFEILLEDAPAGYVVEDTYPMGEDGATIVLESELRTGDFSKASYKLGDIVYDYSIVVDGVTYKFSEILEEKEAIVLNFWFTTCSYCIEEFPDMEASYSKYSDRIALFALNGKLGGDNETAVNSFKNAFYAKFGSYNEICDELKKDDSLKALAATLVTNPNISLNSFDKTKIETEIDALLEIVKSSTDVSLAANTLANAIETAIGDCEENKLKIALANFVNDLREADASNIDDTFAGAKVGIVGAFGLDLTMIKDTNDIESAFGITGNPVTIVIDRYGMFSFTHTGAVPSEKHFDMLFEYYLQTDENYRQNTFNSVTELTPTDKPTAEMPSQEALENALGSEDFGISYLPETESNDAEYAWPFVVTTKDEVTCIKPSNFDKDSSYAALHAMVTLKAGEAFMFDYFASTEQGYDILYVLVNGQDIYTISGASDEWNGCCPWVALEDGTYDVTFVYLKNISDYEGDDAVYLDNFRIVNSSEVDVETYIPRDAVSGGLTDDMSDYKNYITVVLGDDGYYHVGDKNGPLLLASLINYTNYSKTISLTLTISETKELIVDGVNCYEDLIKYCNYASNSQIYSYCPVTPTLQKYLDAFVKQNKGFGTGNPNQWLTLCYYYDAYGTDGKQLEDPIKGLASFSAYEVKEDSPNLVEYNRVIMPRGLLYKFVPTKSGAYRFTTDSDYEVDGWIFIGDHDEWVENGDRIQYAYSDNGERFCTELLIDPDNDGIFQRDYTNATMVAYLEAGKEYYIDFAYYDQYQYGKFTFDVKYIGETFDYFISASPGPFTWEEGIGGAQGDTITGGIDVALGDDGYYHHLLEDGSLGSLLYADFYQYTSTFTEMSIQDLIKSNAFNFAITEVDQEAIAFLSNYGEDGLRNLWGENFDENWQYYQMDDILEGEYHGYIVDGKYKSYGYEYVIIDEETLETELVLNTPPEGAVKAPNYTEVVKKYVELMLNEEGYPERQGCVLVTEELAEALQMLMDKFTFEGVEHSWTKLCYYYEYLGQ